MHIEFATAKLEALANDYDNLCKKFNKKGINNAEYIITTLSTLFAAPALFDVPSGFRPHPLQGERKGQFAVNVTKKERIIFAPIEYENKPFQIDNFKSIQAIRVLELFTNYHS